MKSASVRFAPILASRFLMRLQESQLVYGQLSDCFFREIFTHNFNVRFDECAHELVDARGENQAPPAYYCGELNPIPCEVKDLLPVVIISNSDILR